MTQGSSTGSQTPTVQSTQGTTGATVREMAKETVGQVADQTQQTARHIADQAREQAASRIGTQKDTAAAGLNSVAQALRQTGQTLREQDQAGITSYIDSAASQVEQISNYLQQSDISQLVDDVESFARRRPALFLTGAFALGILGARFLKSSRQQVAPPSNYPIARRDMYAPTHNLYDHPYQQPISPQTTGYGSMSNTQPTTITNVEEQL